MELSSRYVLAVQQTPLLSHTYHLHIARNHTHTHAVYSSLRLSSLSSAGVRTREGSKAQLCLTGPTQSYQRVAELEGRPKTNGAVQVLQAAINTLTQRIQKVMTGITTERFSSATKHFTGLRFGEKKE